MIPPYSIRRKPASFSRFNAALHRCRDTPERFAISSCEVCRCELAARIQPRMEQPRQRARHLAVGVEQPVRRVVAHEPVQPLVELLQQEVIEAALRAVQPLESLQRQLGHAAGPQRNHVGRARTARSSVPSPNQQPTESPPKVTERPSLEVIDHLSKPSSVPYQCSGVSPRRHSAAPAATCDFAHLVEHALARRFVEQRKPRPSAWSAELLRS